MSQIMLLSMEFLYLPPTLMSDVVIFYIDSRHTLCIISDCHLCLFVCRLFFYFFFNTLLLLIVVVDVVVVYMQANIVGIVYTSTR